MALDIVVATLSGSILVMICAFAFFDGYATTPST